jgi:CRP-like cAMP-binding protein
MKRNDTVLCPCLCPGSGDPWQVTAARAPGAVPQRFPKGATIYRQGLPGEGIFVLCEGSVTLVVSAPGRPRRILDIVAAGQPFGLDCLAKNRLRRCSAVARQDCVACYVSRGQVRATLCADSELWWNAFALLAEKLDRVRQERLILTGGRLAEQIESLRRLHAGNGGTAPLRQTEMAALLGVSNESVCRAVKRTRAQGQSQAPKTAHARSGL